MFFLIWLKKNLLLLCISFILILIGFLKKFWRLVKQYLLRVIIAQSRVYFIVLLLISCSYTYVTNCTNNLYSGDVSVSVNSNINGLSINSFDRNFNSSLYNSSRLSYEVRKYQKMNLLSHRRSINLENMNILPFFFMFLLSLIFFRKQKNDPELKIILVSPFYCELFIDSQNLRIG